MTIKSLSQLQTDINTDITSNGIGGITGPELNVILIDTTDSFVHVDFTEFTNLGSGVADSDLILVNDSSDSGNLKYTTIGDLGIGGGGGGTVQPTDSNTYNIRATNEGSISGNARGENSIDLQTVRDNASGVAAASGSVIIGGNNNTINSTALKASILNGDDNDILNASEFSSILGGKVNKIGILGDSDGSVVCCGTQNDIHQGNWNAIVAGFDNVLNNVGAGGSNFIGAGTDNEIRNGNVNFIGGGWRNWVATSGGSYHGNAVVCGNDNKIPQGGYNFIGAGQENKISHNGYGNRNVICGGYDNEILLGGHNTIAGGYRNTIFSNQSNSIGGGRNNGIGKANETHSRYCTVAGGEGNDIGSTTTGDWGFIGGGATNIIQQGKFHSILGGQKNQVTGVTDETHSSICGGYKNRVGNSNCTVLGGFGASASRYGETAKAAGFFGTLDPNIGNAQWGSVIARKETTASGYVEMFLDDSSERITIKEDSTLGIAGNIIGRRTDGGGEASAYYTIEALIDRDTATTTTNLLYSSVTAKYEDNTNWDVAVSADTGNGAFKIEVAGDTSQTVQWVAYLHYVETRDKGI